MADLGDELFLLWHGDEETAGYHHEELVVAVCELHKPAGPGMAVAAFYPGVTLDMVPEEDREMIERGFQLYMRRLSLPNRRRGSAVVKRVNSALGC